MRTDVMTFAGVHMLVSSPCSFRAIELPLTNHMTNQLVAEAVRKLYGYNITNGGLRRVQVHGSIGIRSLEPSMAYEFRRRV